MNLATGGGTAAFFAVATDPERMRAVMAQHLRAPDGPPVDVVACQVGFIRRGGTRGMIEYQLTLRDPASGAKWTQVVGGVTYGGEERTRRAWEHLRQQHPAPPASGTALVRDTYVPELDLLLQVFPFDHQLPALAPLMAGPLPGLVEPLLAQFGPGEWHLTGWEAESIRYRVDLRASLRLTVRAREAGTGEVAERRFYAKIYGTAERAARAWGVQRDVAAALVAGNEPFAIAPLVTYLPEARVLVQGEVQGTSLLEVLHTTDATAAVAAVRRTARAVAALHCLPVAAPPHRLELGRTDLERLRRDAAQLRAARPDLAPAVAAVEEGILTRLATIGDLSSIPTHGDLRPDHVLSADDRVILLDLDKFAAGDPMLDVTNLLMFLRWGQRTGVEGSPLLARAFIEEYFGHVPAAWEPRLAPHYAWALFGHESRIAWALEEAPAVLAGRSWWSGPAADRT